MKNDSDLYCFSSELKRTGINSRNFVSTKTWSPDQTQKKTILTEAGAIGNIFWMRSPTLAYRVVQQRRLGVCDIRPMSLFYQRLENNTAEEFDTCIWGLSKRPRKGHVFGLTFKNADIKTGAITDEDQHHFLGVPKKKYWCLGSFLFTVVFQYPDNLIQSVSQPNGTRLCRLLRAEVHLAQLRKAGVDLGES